MGELPKELQDRFLFVWAGVIPIRLEPFFVRVLRQSRLRRLHTF